MSGHAAHGTKLEITVYEDVRNPWDIQLGVQLHGQAIVALEPLLASEDPQGYLEMVAMKILDQLHDKAHDTYGISLLIRLSDETRERIGL